MGTVSLWYPECNHGAGVPPRNQTREEGTSTQDSPGYESEPAGENADLHENEAPGGLHRVAALRRGASYDKHSWGSTSGGAGGSSRRFQAWFEADTGRHGLRRSRPRYQGRYACH